MLLRSILLGVMPMLREGRLLDNFSIPLEKIPPFGKALIANFNELDCCPTASNQIRHGLLMCVLSFIRNQIEIETLTNRNCVLSIFV